MDLLSSIRKNAAKRGKHIVLPEGEDERTIKAASILASEDICRVTLIGPETDLFQHADKLGISLERVTIIDPVTSEKTDSCT